MLSESEIQNMKKIIVDELGRFFFLNKEEAQKEFDEEIDKEVKKARNLDFSGVHDDKEAFDYICKKV